MEMEAVLPSGGSSRRRWSSRPPLSSRAAWTELRPSEGRGGPATSSSSPASRGGAGNGLAGPLRGGAGQIRWRSGDAARDGAPPPTPSSACGLSRGGAHSGGDSEEHLRNLDNDHNAAAAAAEDAPHDSACCFYCHFAVTFPVDGEGIYPFECFSSRTY
ncbi:unnamed protein product [Urochloa humidicola]